jgi:hypothetical protein
MRSLVFTLFLLLGSHFLSAHGGSITGVVVSADHGELIAGASVHLVEIPLTATTTEIGTFAFGDVADGTYTLVVSFLGFENWTERIQILNHASTTVRAQLLPKSLDLADVEITAPRPNPLEHIGQVNIRSRPVQSSQDILRQVPGLFIAQHAGGGKAEQIFLRGFDIDHGTDIALFADGIPVNMVSHAHGQGYADLHFLIPELVQSIDFQKGTYDARTGNFATAGQVRFETPDVLTQNMVGLEAGQFGTYRAVATLDLLGDNAAARGLNAYVAGEQMFSDGYFDASQNFQRRNAFAKVRYAPDARQVIELSASDFNSNWLASGQIPDRAVARIGRFGAIDSTEGGNTQRRNLNLRHYRQINDNTLIINQLYHTRYGFELYSNFTFWLEDSINGDQIKQRERRQMTGYNGSIEHRTRWGSLPVALIGGVQVRYDQTQDSELSRTRARRETLERLAYGDVQETNAAAFADVAVDLRSDLTLRVGGRFDQFRYTYSDALQTNFSEKTAQRGQFSPKINLTWVPHRMVSVFARVGAGFHSNDTRAIVGATQENLLPTAWGQDLGVHLRPTPRLLLHAAGWHLDLEQEFVYVGDAGVVEPSGRSRRYGLDLSARWQLARYLFFDADYTWTRGRSVDDPEGENRIPLAPVHTGTGGLTVQSPAWNASLRARYLSDRPANADYSLTAEGFFLLDAQVAWAPRWQSGQRPVEFVVSAQNLTNVAWKEAQFETTTRLRDEPAEVTEIHFTPGTPFWLKGGVRFRF